MIPSTPTRHLQQRLQQQQQQQQHHVQQRRESRQLQLQRLQQLLPRIELDADRPGDDGDVLGQAGTSPARSDPGPDQAQGTSSAASRPKEGPPKRTRARSASVYAGTSSASGVGAGPRRHSHARGSAAAAAAAVHGLRKASTASASPFLGRRALGHGPFVLRTPLGVIDSSPEGMASPVGSMMSDHGVFATVLAARCQPLAASAPGAPAAQDGHDSSDNNSLSCQVLPYGAHCESFELAELAYGEAAAPLARISTLEAASINDGDGVNSDPDSEFGVLPTHHGQAADTAADTGVDTGQDADTDQDADCQLSTDSNGSNSSTPHLTTNHERRLYVLPVGVAPRSGSSVVTLHEEPDPSRRSQPPKHARPRPRLARTSKVVVASLDSAASDDCITTTPEQSVQSQEEQEQEREQTQTLASPP